ncbi:MAG: phosphatidic acid phosphatase type [Alectoria fallacina]|uniref:Phosphatidic acid phosphatase type n=1 Tax=Alectoria fallacina TaxID=1903189 RepID=A0A8H3G5G5_9LECA|nr:MAG: phosphatidic acid phosphatase type [Alectoria fallacina]
MASKRLIASYICEWLIIVAAIVTALALSTVNPDYHHFSLLDLTISYPHRERAKVSLGVLTFLSIILPISVIIFISLLVPTPAVSNSNSRERRRQKLRELNANLLGLGVSLATATIVFTGVKNLSGKPRPDFLARCKPDVGNVAAHKVGGYGQAVSELWVMVDGGICQEVDKRWLNDGFRGFPSGYATSEAAQ